MGAEGARSLTESLRQKDRAGNNHKTVFVCTSHFRAAEVYQRFYFILFYFTGGTTNAVYGKTCAVQRRH